jgi:hypothetical protein
MTRLLKNTRLLRYACPRVLRRTLKYASHPGASQALHPDVLEQPGSERVYVSSGFIQLQLERQRPIAWLAARSLVRATFTARRAAPPSQELA